MLRFPVSSMVALTAALPVLADDMRLFSWQASLGADSITQSEADTGHKVVRDVSDSNDTVETRLRAGNSG